MQTQSGTEECAMAYKSQEEGKEELELEEENDEQHLSTRYVLAALIDRSVNATPVLSDGDVSDTSADESYESPLTSLPPSPPSLSRQQSSSVNPTRVGMSARMQDAATTVVTAYTHQHGWRGQHAREPYGPFQQEEQRTHAAIESNLPLAGSGSSVSIPGAEKDTCSSTLPNGEDHIDDTVAQCLAVNDIKGARAIASEVSEKARILDNILDKVASSHDKTTCDVGASQLKNAVSQSSLSASITGSISVDDDSINCENEDEPKCTISPNADHCRNRVSEENHEGGSSTVDLGTLGISLELDALNINTIDGLDRVDPHLLDEFANKIMNSLQDLVGPDKIKQGVREWVSAFRNQVEQDRRKSKSTLSPLLIKSVFDYAVSSLNDAAKALQNAMHLVPPIDSLEEQPSLDSSKYIGERFAMLLGGKTGNDELALKNSDIGRAFENEQIEAEHFMARIDALKEHTIQQVLESPKDVVVEGHSCMSKSNSSNVLVLSSSDEVDSSLGKAQRDLGALWNGIDAQETAFNDQMMTLKKEMHMEKEVLDSQLQEKAELEARLAQVNANISSCRLKLDEMANKCTVADKEKSRIFSCLIKHKDRTLEVGKVLQDTSDGFNAVDKLLTKARSISRDYIYDEYLKNEYKDIEGSVALKAFDRYKHYLSFIKLTIDNCREQKKAIMEDMKDLDDKSQKNRRVGRVVKSLADERVTLEKEYEDVCARKDVSEKKKKQLSRSMIKVAERLEDLGLMDGVETFKNFHSDQLKRIEILLQEQDQRESELSQFNGSASMSSSTYSYMASTSYTSGTTDRDDVFLSEEGNEYHGTGFQHQEMQQPVNLFVDTVVTPSEDCFTKQPSIVRKSGLEGQSNPAGDNALSATGKAMLSRHTKGRTNDCQSRGSSNSSLFESAFMVPPHSHGEEHNHISQTTTDVESSAHSKSSSGDGGSIIHVASGEYGSDDGTHVTTYASSSSQVSEVSPQKQSVKENQVTSSNVHYNGSLDNGAEQDDHAETTTTYKEQEEVLGDRMSCVIVDTHHADDDNESLADSMISFSSSLDHQEEKSEFGSMTFVHPDEPTMYGEHHMIGSHNTSLNDDGSNSDLDMRAYSADQLSASHGSASSSLELSLSLINEVETANPSL